MHREVEFYFDVASPPSYIAHERLPEIAARMQARLVLRPVLAGGIFKLSGNAPPAGVTAKRSYMMQTELPRLARHYGIALDFHPGAPFDSLALMRGAMAADDDGRLADYAAAMFRAMWAEAVDMSDPAAVGASLERAGFDAADIFNRIQAQEVKAQLIAVTGAAVERGVFGVPSFFVNDEMYFGQDHLDFVERALASPSPV